MKKRVLSALLAATMLTGMLAGCGGGKAEEGSVLNIYCWNEEFKSRLEEHYPGYEVIDATTGKIGDVTVKYTIVPSDDNAYQNNLDSTLDKQAKAKADEKIDIFLVEADYALKYVDTADALSVKDLGITDADVANQYQYTKDVVTDSKGNLKGVSWQGCPGALFYNREIAKDVWGTDDAAEIQKKVADWDTFKASAAELEAKGYYVTSSVMDTYRTYSNNVTSKWVVDGKINIDPNIKKWADDAKAMYDAGYTNNYELWGEDWSKGFYPEGNVFCYFGPAWFINFSMAADKEGSVGYNGGWGITEGPQSFYWGGTWICAANGTDNKALVKDIMLKMTCDQTIMTNIVKANDDFVNNKPAMEAMAADASYSSKILGGVNPLPLYVASADGIDLSNMTIYDQACNEEFQNAMKNYFNGEATYEEALELFYKAVEEKHPDLTH